MRLYRFLRSVAITWIVGLVVYTVLVAGGAMLALSAPYSLVLGTLLFLEVSVMLLLYTTMFVRLIKAAKLRLMRCEFCLHEFVGV